MAVGTKKRQLRPNPFRHIPIYLAGARFVNSVKIPRTERLITPSGLGDTFHEAGNLQEFSSLAGASGNELIKDLSRVQELFAEKSQ